MASWRRGAVGASFLLGTWRGVRRSLFLAIHNNNLHYCLLKNLLLHQITNLLHITRCLKNRVPRTHIKYSTRSKSSAPKRHNVRRSARPPHCPHHHPPPSCWSIHDLWLRGRPLREHLSHHPRIYSGSHPCLLHRIRLLRPSREE